MKKAKNKPLKLTAREYDLFLNAIRGEFRGWTEGSKEWQSLGSLCKKIDKARAA